MLTYNFIYGYIAGCVTISLVYIVHYFLFQKKFSKAFDDLNHSWHDFCKSQNDTWKIAIDEMNVAHSKRIEQLNLDWNSYIKYKFGGAKIFVKTDNLN